MTDEPEKLTAEHVLRLEVIKLRQALIQKNKQVAELEGALAKVEEKELLSELRNAYDMKDGDRIEQSADGLVAVRGSNG